MPTLKYRDQTSGQLVPLLGSGMSEAAADARYVIKSGDTMTGPLLMSSTIPTTDLEAASKSYVDQRERAFSSDAASWNTLTQPGPYGKLVRGSNANGPGTTYYYYLTNYVYSGTAGVALPPDHTQNMTQVAVPYNGGPTYVRYRYNSTWNTWRNIAFETGGGLDMGANVASAINNFTEHINLYDGTYGFSVTSGTLNIVHGGAVQFAQAATAQIQLRSSGINYLATTAVTGGSNAIAMRWSSPNINGGVDNANTCVLGVVSARKWKSAISTLKKGALDKVKKLRAVEYTPNETDGKPIKHERHHGLITDEVRRILPGAVSGPSEGDAVNYMEIVPLLVAAVQELSDEVELLKARAA